MRKAIGSAMAEAAKGSAYGDVGMGRKTFRDAVASGQLIAGSPEQVSETLIEVCAKFKIGNVACLMAPRELISRGYPRDAGRHSVVHRATTT